MILIYSVGSSAAIWGEWLACVPLLHFITITIIDKPTFTRMDMMFMCASLLCILFGLLIVFNQPLWSSILCLILSFITFLPCLYHPYYLSYNHQIDIIDCIENNSQQEQGSSLYKKECYSRRFNMSSFLTICMILHPLNYVVSLFRGYKNQAIDVAIYLALSVITKSVYAIGIYR